MPTHISASLKPPGRFEEALEHILNEEGGYVNHPLDPGGATNMGITLRVFRRWRAEIKPGSPKPTKSDLQALTKSEAAAIYQLNYWQASSAHLLPVGLDLLVFDCAVNQGPGRAAKFLQRAVGAKVDGKIGPNTLAKVKSSQRSYQSSINTMVDFCTYRFFHYTNLHHWMTFRTGWTRRLLRTYRHAVISHNSEVERNSV